MNFLERTIFKALERKVKIAMCNRPLPEKELSLSEHHIFRKFTSPTRRQEWLTGRAALKSLLRSFEENEETSRLVFPNRRFSLSHSEDRAIAVGLFPGAAGGIGVDLQLERTVQPRMARFYLTEHERAWVMGQDERARPRELLRLWTIKEALFKANSENHGTLLRQYKLIDPRLGCGRAIAPGESKATLRYVSLEIGERDVSLAIAVRHVL